MRLDDPRSANDRSALGVKEFQVRPDPDDPRLSVAVTGIDQEARRVETAVVTERPLTLFLNAREIVTMMTIGDHPDLLAVGYLLNQNMLRPTTRSRPSIMRMTSPPSSCGRKRQTNFEEKLKKKTLTSGCAQGTVFGDLMEEFEQDRAEPACASEDVLALSAHEEDQHRAEPLSEGRRHSRLRAVRMRTGR